MKNNSRLQVLRWMLARLTGDEAPLESRELEAPMAGEPFALEAEEEPLVDAMDDIMQDGNTVEESYPVATSPARQRLAILQDMLRRLTGEP